jgi:type IV pilus assembly protein PilB
MTAIARTAEDAGGGNGSPGRGELPRDLPRGLTPPAQRGRSRKLIGDVIVELGLATRETVDDAVSASRRSGATTGQILVANGTLRQDQLAHALAERFGVDFVDLSVYEINMGAVNLIPPEMARRYQAVPVGFLADRSVLLAMADPANVLTIDELSMITGMRMRPAAASADDIAALILKLNRLDETVAEIEEDEEEPEAMVLDNAAPDAPIIKLVHSIIAQGVEHGASDIHCNPEIGEMQVLYRIDGVMTPAATIAASMAPSVVSRIKIMASLNIAEKRAAQDGRLALTVDGRRIDIRVVTLPLVRGEGVVMRILDSGVVVRDLTSLGMQEGESERFLATAQRPHGAVLVTGPTGSGKSTTLYGVLGVINDGERSIITIEDPVESTIPGIKQVQVNAKTGVSFAAGLRSILRADPDVIMVGEIRDRETAEIAVQAALTGHLVLSTLHTRDAPSAVSRLIDMGIEPFMVSAAIDCVVAQRLARTLCDQCKRPASLPESVLAENGLTGATVYEPVGCIRCNGTGYHGRTGFYEVMPITEDIRTLILQRRGADEIEAAAIHGGMRTMLQDGIEKVRQGLTSLVEINRVMII